ncbi:hypothetical protein BS47DRAFT_1389135 [Hydnum rufescens UP504]|uniref:Uncharacterized protein n=1 Tax=Hydnum rufescens UP504 TaxID=1448309 RepID=A0A9P6DY83_9AGAM|nr:hypothetical protein BS47DRAFT_1389135 [Hydnum rufescens UP504]
MRVTLLLESVGTTSRSHSFESRHRVITFLSFDLNDPFPCPLAWALPIPILLLRTPRPRIPIHYHSHIGITHYITGRLREEKPTNLDDVWDFTWFRTSYLAFLQLPLPMAVLHPITGPSQFWKRKPRPRIALAIVGPPLSFPALQASHNCVKRPGFKYITANQLPGSDGDDDEGESSEEEDTHTFGQTSTMAFSLSRKTPVTAMKGPALVRKRTGRTMGNLQSLLSQSTLSLSLGTSITQHLDPVTSQLLQSHYCRSQVQFLALENVFNQLLVEPKLAVDILSWTSGADSPIHASKSPDRARDRIVRIPPGECVVLNSAGSLPYIPIEIPIRELDFVPLKHANQEILRGIIAEEHKMQRPRRSDTGQPLDPNSLRRATGKPHFLIVVRACRRLTTLCARTFRAARRNRLRGTTLRDRSFIRTQPAELSDSVVLPPTLKKKALNIVRPIIAFHVSAHLQSEHATDRLLSCPSSPLSPATAFQTIRDTHIIGFYPSRTTRKERELGPSSIVTIAFPPQQLDPPWSSAVLNWVTGSRPCSVNDAATQQVAAPMRTKLQRAEATAIRDKIMQEMMPLEEEHVELMKRRQRTWSRWDWERQVNAQTVDDEGFVRRELKSGPLGGCLPRIVDYEKSTGCLSLNLPPFHTVLWALSHHRGFFRHHTDPSVLFIASEASLGTNSELVETVKDTVSIHSIKKAEYARRLPEGRFGHVTLMDHFIALMAMFSPFFLSLLSRRLIHLDFGFLLSNSPRNTGFEAAPFKFSIESVEVLSGVDREPFNEFKRLLPRGLRDSAKALRQRHQQYFALYLCMLPAWGP